MSREQILEAILTNRSIDYSKRILDGADDAAPVFEDHWPPVMIAASQAYPRATNGRPTRQTTFLRRFELMSLAARAAAFEIKPEPGYSWTFKPDRMPEFSAMEVTEAIAAACAKLSLSPTELAEPWLAHHAPALKECEDHDKLFALGEERHLSRRGLQIIGARIRGDLTLVNADLPFSLRFIGCVFEGAVIADHCRVTTLDFSGSVLKGGLYATYLSARGSVRLRRAVSTGCIDLGGAHVRGVFDASDSIVLPHRDAPSTEPAAGDRGIVNLSLVTIENETRFIRARIYGGLTMKGCEIHRSLFLDDAILRSPLSLLEKVAWELCPTDKRETFSGTDIELHANAELELLGDAALFSSMQELEFCHFVKMRGDDNHAPELLERLLGESVRARTSSLRGDGARIKGSVFARNLRSGGRLRFKYANIGGGLHLKGARLRSAQASSEGLKKLLGQLAVADRKGLQDLEADSAAAASSAEPEEGVDLALDARDCVTDGNFDLGSAPPRIHPDSETALTAAALQGPARTHLARKISTDRVPACILGAIDLSAAKIGGSLTLNGAKVNIHGVARDGDTLLLQRATINGDVDLRGCETLRRIRAEQVTIGGSLSFAAEKDVGSGQIDGEVAEKITCVIEAATWREDDQGSELQFTGAKIGHDATFVFDPARGPTLKLSRLEACGKLSILPSEGTLKFDMSDIKRHSNMRLREIPEKPPFEIDLRNATTTVLAHPPASWPDPNGLVIDGFHYARARNFGPLLPPRKYREEMRDDEVYNRNASLRIAVGIVAVMLLVAGIDHVFHRSIIAAGEAFGMLNLTALTTIGLIVVGRAIVGVATRPTRRRMKPMALWWLHRQRTRANVQRRKAPDWPLQPFIQAAHVLRNSGQVEAANRVDLERLRSRRAFLSWRNAFPARLFLKFIDLTTRYGFSPARTVGITLLVVVLSAMVFHQADQCGVMRHNDDKFVALHVPYPEFVSMGYALDVFVPVIDLGQASAWAPAANVAMAHREACVSRALPASAFVFAAWLLQVIGWFFTTAIAVALLTRAEVLVSHAEE